MEKNESEKVIRETIEYANREIEKCKKKARQCVVLVVLGVLTVLIAYFAVFVYESPVKYQKELLDVVIPQDQGIDIHVNLSNYQRAYGLLRESDDGYDLYLGTTQTVWTKLFGDADASDHLLRVGSGIIVDYHGNQLLGFLPEGEGEEAVRRIYYVDGRFHRVAAMSPEELLAYKNKTLIWER